MTLFDYALLLVFILGFLLDAIGVILVANTRGGKKTGWMWWAYVALLLLIYRRFG
jgi:hypothetical protein